MVLNVRSKADNSVQESKVPLNNRIVLGRGPDCAVLLDGQGISREHLAVESEDSAIFITDVSSNGTWLNGKRLLQNGRSRVQAGDLVEVPGYEMRFHVAGGDVLQDPLPASGEVKSLTASSVSTSLNWLEKFAILVSLLSVALLLFYLYS